MIGEILRPGERHAVIKKTAWCLLIMSSVLLVAGSWAGRLAMGLDEVFGFITGAVCVLLVVEEHIWNWPVGIANSVFFIVLFIRSRLFGDMALQWVYVVLGFIGWYQWLYGGQNRTQRSVNRMPLTEGVILSLLSAAATALLTVLLGRVHDAAPFLDALTTVLSLAAQYLLTLKRIENWYLWIAADVIYVGLYLYKDLVLTAALYAIFIGMCVAGLAAWRRRLAADAARAA